MKSRPCQNDAVEQGHRHADVDAVLERPQRSARGGAVDVDPLALPPIAGRDDEGLAVADEADTADEAHVEVRGHRRAVVAAAVVQPLYPVAPRHLLAVAPGNPPCIPASRPPPP